MAVVHRYHAYRSKRVEEDRAGFVLCSPRLNRYTVRKGAKVGLQFVAWLPYPDFECLSRTMCYLVVCW